MKQSASYSMVSEPSELLKLLPQIVALADSEKEALGFWPENSLQEAIQRTRLMALVSIVGQDASLVGYVHHSGIFPHAKVQQIAIESRHRRNGGATTLVNMLVSKLEGQGYLTLKAEIAENLIGSLSFYTRNGFVQVAKRQGGAARKRAILIHVRDLETDSLFSFADRQKSAQSELGIRRRSAGEDPSYAFDLNVYFDLVRDRTKSEQARRLFASALSHDVRLVVADEFVTELRRTSKDQGNDPVLQLALKLPRLPKADATELAGLATQVHDLVFSGANSGSAGKPQSLSDSAHLAHAALSRASAFITRDSALLDARATLLADLGIDVISLDEIVALLPPDAGEARFQHQPGSGFQLTDANVSEVTNYLRNAGVSDIFLSEFAGLDRTDIRRNFRAVRSSDQFLAVGSLLIPRGMKPLAKLLIHARPDQPDAGLFADLLLDQLTREACAENPIALEMVHIPGQSATNSNAQARGFERTISGTGYRKIALGRPVTSDNWVAITDEVRRKTGLTLSANMPSSDHRNEILTLQNEDGDDIQVSGSQLENFLSPAVFVWPGQNGVLVPIGQAFANELLGTNPQRTFEFVENKDAAFLTRRAYVNSPRNSAIMPLDAPILFYESKRTGGRGAIVAVARIVDRVVVAKSDLPKDGQRRLVVDSVEEFSASDDVLITTFDNVFPLPKPVPLRYLKTIRATGNANLISAVSLSSEKITKILSQGWLREFS